MHRAGVNQVPKEKVLVSPRWTQENSTIPSGLKRQVGFFSSLTTTIPVALWSQVVYLHTAEVGAKAPGSSTL